VDCAEIWRRFAANGCIARTLKLCQPLKHIKHMYMVGWLKWFERGRFQMRGLHKFGRRGLRASEALHDNWRGSVRIVITIKHYSCYWAELLT
jgi:hypothetical protein